MRGEGFHEPGIEDLLLLIAERLAAKAEELNLEAGDDLGRIYAYFKSTVSTLVSTTKSEGSLDTKAEAKVPPTFQWLSGLLFEAKATAKIQGGINRQTTTTQADQHRITELARGVYSLMRSVAAAAATAKQPPILIIIEDLDKVGFGCARGLFLDNPTLLGGLLCSVLFTAPISLYASPLAANVEEFSRISLPMIRVVRKDGTPDPGGMALIRDIICGDKGRMDPSLFAMELVADDAVLDHAIVMTGGVLRQLFEVLADAANAALVERDRPVHRGGRPDLVTIERSHVEYGLAKARQRLQPMISLSGVDPPPITLIRTT